MPGCTYNLTINSTKDEQQNNFNSIRIYYIALVN